MSMLEPTSPAPKHVLCRNAPCPYFEIFISCVLALRWETLRGWGTEIIDNKLISGTTEKVKGITPPLRLSTINDSVISRGHRVNPCSRWQSSVLGEMEHIRTPKVANIFCYLQLDGVQSAIGPCPSGLFAELECRHIQPYADVELNVFVLSFLVWRRAGVAQQLQVGDVTSIN